MKPVQAMNRLKTLIAIALMSFTSMGKLYAQASNEVEMADLMRSNGKIYVVVAVALIVMIGLIIYVISVDRKVSRIEKKVNLNK